MGDEQAYGHAGGVNQSNHRSPEGTCGARHPLVVEVWCARLPGHPGEHQAFLETKSSEMNFEWRDREAERTD